AAMIPHGTASAPRVSVPVALTVGGTSVAPPTLALRGPGDIAGFDSGCVRRTWPAAGEANAESNYFPLLELSYPDLPWRYTPAATDGDRLTPWLCLVVAEQGEINAQVPNGANGSLGAVTL